MFPSSKAIVGGSLSSSVRYWLGHHQIYSRQFQTCSVLGRSQSGRFKVSIKHDNPLTYEQAHKPHEIAMRKAWNSMNTSALDFEDIENHHRKGKAALFGLRTSQTLQEDIFIRKFMSGTWHNLFLSEILIKRQANMIRIAGIVLRAVPARKMYFLIGYCEELLSYWLQCPVKLELQTVDDKKDVIFKYV